MLWSQGNLVGGGASQNELGNYWSHDKFIRAISAAAIGALLAAATIPLHLLLSKTQSEQFAAVLFAVTGAIYVGFSLQKGIRARLQPS